MRATLSVTVVGCSGSFPGPRGAASCYLIESVVDGVGTRVVLDLGNGSLGPLQSYTDPVDVDAILITHLHADHFIDLCGLYVLRKYHHSNTGGAPQVLYGPGDLRCRLQLAHSGSTSITLDDQFETRTVVSGQPIEVGSLTVVPTRVEHPIEAYGYRLESPAGTVAFTGDTDSCPALTPLLHKADLVFADAAFVEGRDATRGIHLTGRRAAEAAVAAGGVERLVLTHIPPWNDPEVGVAEASPLWPGVEVATPGARYVVSR